MAVDAVIFDWGGTLTPWHRIDPVREWARGTGCTTGEPDAVIDRLCDLPEAIAPWR